MKKSRSHRKGRASGSESRRNHNTSSNKSRSSGAPRPLQRNASSTSSHNSHSTRRDQLVDLVVEDVEAEEEDRAQTQRETGSAWAAGEPRHFS